jgi:lipoprotein-anchoring transpeptidase ErfK/SrfK
MSPLRPAVAMVTAMVMTVAASGYVHRDRARILAAQAVPPARPFAPKPAAATAAPAAQPAASPYVIKRILPIEGPMKIGEHHWDDAGVPAGDLIITVDLAAQVLSVFRGGYEIGAAAILYGADAKPTPLGIYPITQKDADHVSNIYHAPMPYMLRLTNDGVAIHASDVQDGYMTHGCIGVPLAFAKKLFGVAKLGDRVIVTRGETLEPGKPIPAA